MGRAGRCGWACVRGCERGRGGVGGGEEGEGRGGGGRERGKGEKKEGPEQR